MADQFDCGNHTKRILLVANFLHAELLDLADLLELALVWPLKVVLTAILIKSLKHGQLTNTLLGPLHLRRSTFLGG